MAKTWLKAEKPFSRRIGGSMVVGHPKHSDVRGRFAEVDEGTAANELIDRGYAKRISEKEYRKALEAEVVMAGDNMKAQVAGEAPKASPTMSGAQLEEMAVRRKVDLSGAKTHADRVKLINNAGGDVSATEVPDNAFSATAGETRDTTLHPQRSGTQADVTPQGTTDRNGIGASGVTDAGGEIAADEDAAPSGSEEGGGDGGEPSKS